MTSTRILLCSFAALSLLSSCVTKNEYNQGEMQGITGWVMDGAQMEDTVPVERPDNQLDPIQRKIGAVGFGFTEKVETPEQAAARKKTVDRLFNR